MPYSEWKFSFMSHNISTPIRGRADGAMINNNYTFLFVRFGQFIDYQVDDLNLMAYVISLYFSGRFQKFSGDFFFSKFFFSLWVFCRTFINSQDRIQSLLSV